MCALLLSPGRIIYFEHIAGLVVFSLSIRPSSLSSLVKIEISPEDTDSRRVF